MIIIGARKKLRKLEESDMNNTQITVKNRENIRAIQALRGLAFLEIFLSHSNVPLIGASGAWGVSIFIVLSGFLMVYRYYDKQIVCNIHSVFKFSTNKISKLYHLHILAMLVDLMLPALFSGKALMHSIKTEAPNILLNTLLIQSWVPNKKQYYSMNSVAWFLSACLFFYLVFPVFLKLLKKNFKRISIVGMILSIYLIQIAIGFFSSTLNIPQTFSDDFVKWVTYVCPLYRLGDFMIGGLLGLLFLTSKETDNLGEGSGQQKRLLSNSVEVLALLFFLLAELIYAKEINILSYNWFRWSNLWMPSSLLIVWSFAKNKGALTKSLCGKWLIKLGDFSGYAFLLHQITIKVVRRSWLFLFGVEVLPILCICVSLPISLILSGIYQRFRQDRSKELCL